MGRKVCFIGTDGGRRDFMYREALAGRAKNMKSLLGVMKSHATCDVQPIKPQSGPDYKDGYYWKTCPGWSSCTTGCDNDKTRVADNTVKSIRTFYQTSKKYPTFLRVAHKAGFRTLAAGRPNVMGNTSLVCRKCSSRREVTNGERMRKKAPCAKCGHQIEVPFNYAGTGKHSQMMGILDADFRNGYIDHYKGVVVAEGGPAGDKANVDFFIKNMKSTDVAFVHLDSMDQAGHAHGWGSPKYIEAVHHVDRSIGRILSAIKRDTGNDWLVLLTSDHGGFGREHGINDTYDNCIPFLSSKPLDRSGTIRQFDIAPTALGYMGIRPKNMDGICRLKHQTYRKNVTMAPSKKPACKDGKTRRKDKNGNMRCMSKKKPAAAAKKPAAKKPATRKKPPCKDGKTRRKDASGKMRCMRKAGSAPVPRAPRKGPMTVAERTSVVKACLRRGLKPNKKRTKCTKTKIASRSRADGAAPQVGRHSKMMDRALEIAQVPEYARGRYVGVRTRGMRKDAKGTRKVPPFVPDAKLYAMHKSSSIHGMDGRRYFVNKTGSKYRWKLA